MLLNTFDTATTKETLSRLENLKSDTKQKWGKMNAGQMLAHLNVSYDMAYGKVEIKNSWLTNLLMKTFVKKIVVGENPYPQNSRTAPVFIISDAKDFEKEKHRLIAYIKETETKGVNYFEGRASASFGSLTSKEWSNMFYKHIDHHFKQFGV